MNKTHDHSARLEMACLFLVWGGIYLWLLIKGIQRTERSRFWKSCKTSTYTAGSGLYKITSIKAPKLPYLYPGISQ